MDVKAKIFIAGPRGLVGSALVRELRVQGYNNLLTPTHLEGDLTDPVWTKWFFSVHHPEYVFFCAARVGGIADNVENKVDFFMDNMKMQLNVISNASDYGVKKLLFIGTSCVYPRDCPQPIREEYLLTGPLENTTEAYSIAKIAGLKLCRYYREQFGDNFITALPCNIFGERDNFNEKTAHCLPGMLARLHRAKTEGAPTFSVWGDGSAKREFLFAPDLARALIVVMQRYSDAEPINTGSGFELSIKDLAIVLAGVVGYTGDIVFDPSQPAGTPRKVLDNSKLATWGWTPQTPFLDAVRTTYEWFKTS